VGTALGGLLAEQGHRVFGVRRNASALPPPISGLSVDLRDRAALESVPRGIEYVFYAAAPDSSSDATYRDTYVTGLTNLLDAAQAQRWPLRRVFFTSSTAVYAQQDGEWVDEDSETAAVRYSGARMLEAEQVLFESALPATSVRFGGIYGPGRTRLLERVQRGVATYEPGAPAFTNRIHRDDCARVLWHLMSLSSPERVYLAVDDEPVDLETLLKELARALGAPEPKPASDSKEASGRRSSGNKRCRNARLRQSGYSFEYPTFREGYAELARSLLAGT